MGEFSFPYAAYDIQVSLMQEIYNCIEGRKVGIFESPTGTGKSLSTICAVLTWLERFEKRERARLEDQIKTAGQTADGDGDDWVAAYRKKFDAKKKAGQAEEELELMKKVDERLRNIGIADENRKRRFVKTEEERQEAPEDKDPDEEFAPPESYSSDPEAEQCGEPELSCTKIFYASRTHSQLQQFTDEIAKTRFGPRVVTLGSRQTLCLNDDVRALKTSSLINEKCNELRENKSGGKRLKDEDKAVKRTAKRGCPFAKSDAIEELGDQILAVQTPNPSRVLEAGRKLCGCPYFASRKAMGLCQLVLMPYQVLLHEATRQAWGISLKDNVVVIDEAHNLLQTIASVHAVELSESAITVGLSLIRDYIERYRSRLAAKNLLYMRQLLTLVTSLSCVLNTYAKKSTDTSFTMSNFLIELNSAEIDFFKLLRYMDRTRLCKKFHGFYLRYKNIANAVKVRSAENISGVDKILKKKQAAVLRPVGNEDVTTDGDGMQKVSASPIFVIKQFIESLTTKCSDARIIVEHSSNNRQAMLKFMLLNAADKLIDVVKEARSLVLIGGTMEPAGYLFHSLNKICKVPTDNIMRFSCGHVIDDNQLTAISIGSAPGGVDLTLNFVNRARVEVLNGIAMVLLNLLRFIPNGAIAFFPSYDYMSLFAVHLKSCKLFEKLNAIKSIFFEAKENSSVLWNEFLREARKNKGALLCAVVGGKLSEGINFSNELGRCVFMIGLPYPNKNDLELSEKMKYLDGTLGPGAGSEMYEATCLHAVNQAIGRVIRHRQDYAAIVLIDSRYTRPAIFQGLPGWIKSRLKHCNSFGDAVSAISSFFKLRKQFEEKNSASAKN